MTVLREHSVDSQAHRKVSSLPGIFASVFLFSLGVLVWPGLLEKMFSLDWRLGNMRPVAYSLQALLGLLAVTCLLLQGQISCLYSKWFPSRKHAVFAAVAFSLSSIASLAAAEIGLRLLHFPFTDQWVVSEDALAQFDPELGWSYVPNRTVVQQFGTAKHRVPMYFDDLGCRVRAPGVQHDSAVPTVLFVGDSLTFGHGLLYEETFIGQLESMPGFPFQVVNLGVQAYGTDQSLLTVKRWFKKFNTKVVVYTFGDRHVDWNRVSDRRLLYRFNRFLGTKPLFALGSDAAPYLKKRPIRYEALNYSHLWACFEIFMLRWGPKPSLDLTRALVREMKKYVEVNGASLIVIYWNQRLGNAVARDSPFSGMNLNVIDTDADPPPGWSTWRIAGDGHPDARAHLYVAHLLFEALVHDKSTRQNLKDR